MKLRIAAAFVVSLLAAGCSGSGGGQPAAPVPIASSSAPQAQNATITFAFPVTGGSAAQGRSPHYISPNSRYFVSTIDGFNGLQPGQFPIWLAPVTTVGLTVGGNCAIAAGVETCTVVVPTYPGRITYTFAVQDAAKQTLSSVTGLFVVKQGTNTTLNFTLQGVPATFAISSLPKLESHLPLAMVLPTLASDASGAAITSSAYANPITLTDNDPSGATALSLYAKGAQSSSVVIPTATTPVKLNYTGLAIAPFTLTATANGMTTYTITVSPRVDPIQLYGPIADTLSASDPNFGQPTVYINSANTSVSFTVEQPGWSNAPFSKTFTVATDPATCNGVATVSSTDNLKFLVKPVTSAGICKLTVSGGGGATAVLYAAVTTSAIGINGRHR